MKKQQNGSKTTMVQEATDQYVVEELVDIRVNDQGVQQVLVKWEGYRRRTWEPYDSMQKQLREMLEALEQQLSPAGIRQSIKQTNNSITSIINDPQPGDGDEATDHRRAFLQAYIDEHDVDASYRWVPDPVIALELAASLHHPPIKDTVEQLLRGVMDLVHSS